MASPAWFTSVMGTGILGIDIVASPIAIPHGSIVGAVVWGLAAIHLAVIVVLLALRAAVAPAGLAATLRDPAVAQLWGAPPMAAFTIAVGLMRIAVPHGGGQLAIGLAQGLWIVGAAGSLLTAFCIPLLMMTKLEWLVAAKASGVRLAGTPGHLSPCESVPIPRYVDAQDTEVFPLAIQRMARSRSRGNPSSVFRRRHDGSDRSRIDERPRGDAFGSVVDDVVETERARRCLQQPHPVADAERNTGRPRGTRPRAR